MLSQRQSNGAHYMYITHTNYTHTHILHVYYMQTWILQREFTSRRLWFFARHDVPRKWKANQLRWQRQPRRWRRCWWGLCSVREPKSVYNKIFGVPAQRMAHTHSHTHTDKHRENVSHFELSWAIRVRKKTNFIWGKTHQISRAGVAIIIFHSTCM